MRKMKNHLKTGILLLGILISMTNCEKEEFSIDSSQTTIDEKSLYEVPNTSSAKENFQNLNNFRNPLVSSVLIAKKKDNKFFIDWNNSKSINFKKKENINILYTPIIYNKKGKRNKSFIASIANKNNEIESFIFSVFYDRLATDEIFSGYISKFDSSGKAIELYKYKNGLLKTTYTFKKEKNSSKKGYSNRDSYDDCGGTTMEDILFIMDYLLEYGETGETVYFGDCVYITSSGGGGGGDNSWSNPDMNLSGGFIPLGENYNYTAGGGGGSSTTTTTDVLIAPEGLQWWAEDFDISPTSYLINNIQNLTSEQVDWINDPVNSNVVDQLNNFLITNGNTPKAKNFAELAIDTYINKSDFNLNDFDNFNQFIPDYKARMTQQELLIFNSMSIEYQTRYLYNANKAQNKAFELFPGIQRNTKADAFRHSYFHGLNTYFIGENLSIQLGDAHENETPNSLILEKVMDLFNNQVGREKSKTPAIYFNAYGTLVVRIFDAIQNGDLKYLNPLNSDGTINSTTQLIPTNQ